MRKLSRGRRSARLLIIAALAAALAGGSAARAQEAAKDEGAKEFAPFVADLELIDGLFPLYRDKKSGKLYLEVKAEQLGRDFIHFAYTEDGVTDAGHFRGQHHENRIVRFERSFDRILISALNTKFYFDPASALARAADANISSAVLVSAPIKAADHDSTIYLIEAAPLFLTDALTQVRPTDDPDNKKGEKFELGKLSPEKTRFSRVRNYPANTDLIVDYVFDNPEPMNYGSDALADGRFVTIRMQHSLIEAPPAGYQPRLDDYRVGFFTEKQTDLTSTDVAPYHDLIQRWRLEKKDPAAALSDPVTPITFWIENTTPVELRAAITEGVLAWNKAFEKAGFTNALKVEVQPDDAEWDAGDVRYNVIRWTSSPDPPFSGYGPSFTDPRTGEIIGADIMLEYAYITSRLRRQELFESAALENYAGPDASWPFDPRLCDFGAFMQHELLLGATTLTAAGASGVEVTRLIDEAVRRLVLHEVGHTLGLSHNMKSSIIRPLGELNAEGKPLTGSVMDYVPVNIAREGEQGAFYQSAPGPYDMWAIEFGYRPPLADAAAEAAHATALVARSTEPELAFGNDADDMRSPGKAIDPRVMVGDLSSDPVAWAEDRIALVNDTMAAIKDKFVKPDASYQALRQAYIVLTAEESSAAEIVSRYIGGVYVERAAPGQNNARVPYTPVPPETQKQAMAVLAAHIFAPDAFAVPADLAQRLQIQRRAFDLRETTEDPKIHARALAIQGEVLDQLLNPVMLERLTDTRLYGNTYTADQVLGDLTGAIFDADKGTSVNTFRQNLQVLYVSRLAKAVADEKASKDYDPVAQSAILAQLDRIDALAAPKLFETVNAESKAHRRHLRLIIARALDEDG